MDTNDMSYEQAIRQAVQMEDIAMNMLGMAERQFQTTLGEIEMIWQGDASKEFQNFGKSTQSMLCEQSENLRQLAQQIREAAKTLMRT